MKFINDHKNFINNPMITKHQLAFNLKSIVVNYHHNQNLERFHRKIIKHSKNISLYISHDIFIDFKSDIKKIYDDMINGEFDHTIINDCIQNIERIILILLVFI
jgi:hypothetical protein